MKRYHLCQGQGDIQAPPQKNEIRLAALEGIKPLSPEESVPQNK